MKTKIFFLFLICTTHVRAQDSFIAQILVKNFDELAVVNAEVQLCDTNGVFISKGITDADGQFKLNMKPGKYQIKLLLGGVQKKERSINLPELDGRKMYNNVRIFVFYEERKQFTLENLLFENNSAVIEMSSYSILDNLVDYLKNENDTKFEIGGHTDNFGDEKSNQILSEYRAKEVVAFLISKGISEDQIIAKGYGESNPVADNTTPEGRAQNRRTEVRKLE